jgi:uncharacterized protein (DUF305 family)
MAFSYAGPTALGQPAQSGAAHEAEFLAENDAAMITMMDGMMIGPTGDIDQDFAAMMIAHHQGAIDMARVQLRYGSNEQLRQIAREIIVDQTRKIDVMRLAIGQKSPPMNEVPVPFEPISQPPSRSMRLATTPR